MTRVSTAGNYQSALLNLQAAQAQQTDAQTRVSTRKAATDLSGFGRTAESVTALRGAQSRTQGYLDVNAAVSARLTIQDVALTQISDAVGDARAAIGGALASGSTDNLMLELQNQFQSAQTGLNTRHQGAYLFAGTNSDQAPVAVSTLADLAAAPGVASVFTNDRIASVSRLDEATVVQTGFLADTIGSEALQIFRDIQAFHADPATGPLTGKPTDGQKAFLSAQLARLDTAKIGVIEAGARNGALQKQVESKTDSHEAQLASLDELVGKKTDADMARAVTDLKLSELAVQASAQVISQLSQVSLLNYLR